MSHSYEVQCGEGLWDRCLQQSHQVEGEWRLRSLDTHPLGCAGHNSLQIPKLFSPWDWCLWPSPEQGVLLMTIWRTQDWAEGINSVPTLKRVQHLEPGGFRTDVIPLMSWGLEVGLQILPSTEKAALVFCGLIFRCCIVLGMSVYVLSVHKRKWVWHLTTSPSAHYNKCGRGSTQFFHPWAAGKVQSYLVLPKPMILNKDILKIDASYPVGICYLHLLSLP